MSDLLISELTEDMLEGAALLEASCFSRPWSMEDLKDAMEKKDIYLFLTSLYEGKPAAQACLVMAGNEADVTNVACNEEFRRRGFAGEILVNLIEKGKERGIKAFFLEVRSSNTAAIGLYEKLGFKTEGVRKSFYRDPKEDALIMWKRD